MSPMHLNGENCQNVILGEILYGNGQRDLTFMIPGVCPHPGVIYMHIIIMFKDLLL